MFNCFWAGSMSLTEPHCSRTFLLGRRGRRVDDEGSPAILMSPTSCFSSSQAVVSSWSWSSLSIRVLTSVTSSSFVSSSPPDLRPIVYRFGPVDRASHPNRRMDTVTLCCDPDDVPGPVVDLVDRRHPSR